MSTDDTPILEGPRYKCRHTDRIYQCADDTCAVVFEIVPDSNTHWLTDLTHLDLLHGTNFELLREGV